MWGCWIYKMQNKLVWLKALLWPCRRDNPLLSCICLCLLNSLPFHLTHCELSHKLCIAPTHLSEPADVSRLLTRKLWLELKLVVGEFRTFYGKPLVSCKKNILVSRQRHLLTMFDNFHCDSVCARMLPSGKNYTVFGRLLIRVWNEHHFALLSTLHKLGGDAGQ